MSRSTPPQVQRLLWTRFSWRHARQAPWTTALLVLTLALGVAVYLAIRLANRAAVSSFRNFTDVVTAESDGMILAPAGSLPESLLTGLRKQFPDTPVHWVPVLESTAVEPGDGSEGIIGNRTTYTLLGVDWVALQNLAQARRAQAPETGPGSPPEPNRAHPSAAVPPRDQESGSVGGGTLQDAGTPGEQALLWARLQDPRAVLVPAAVAARLGSPTLRLVIQERIVDLQVAGVLPDDPAQPRAPDNLLLFDLPALQALTARPGQLDRIEFVLPEGPDRPARASALRRDLEAWASGRWLLSSPSERRDNAATMTQAFRLNLTILSLLALLVGLMLVYQALDGAVVRRREEIAILRSLGVEPGRIRRAWWIEAAVLGLCGGALGLLLGWAGAQGAVRGVGQTVNSLYYATTVRSASLDPVEAAVALVLAVAASLAAGGWPARQAANTPPAQRLGRGRARAGSRAPRWVLPGALALLGLGGLLATLPALRLEGGSRISLAAFGSALTWLLGAGLLAGLLPPMVLGRLAAWDRLSGPARLGLSHLRRPTGRHRLAIAGLVCAVAMTAGMAILVGSFDTTLRGWIERTFMADLYVSSEGAQSASTQNRIQPETWKSLVAEPEVLAANVVQAVELQLPGGSTLLFGGNPAFMRDQARIAWREAPTGDALWDPARNSGLALASESFSHRFRLHRGDTLTLPTPAGPKVVTLAGIFSDYGNERGAVVVQREHFAAWFGDELATSIIAKLHDSADAATVRARWKAAHPGLAVYTQPHLRGEALRIFRQTFAITDALELIGVAVSVLGLGFTLASLLWERRDDLTTLRALGFRHGEIAWATTIESLVTATVGIGVGLAASLALGWLLIHRVNVQTFGWTLETDPPWLWMTGLALAVLTMAGLTGWSIGRWGASLPAEREE
jgi:putative ABC transport system permease protein